MLQQSNRIKGILLIWLSIMILAACSHGRRRRIEPIDQYSGSVNRYGSCEKKVQRNVPTVYQYNTLDNLRMQLYHTPDGKVDKIIRENPDWQFVFYCECQPSDSSELRQLLKRYVCNFTVILDPDMLFLKHNALDTLFSAIGFICDAKGHALGGGLIGTTQSFFDSEFNYAKYQIKQRKRSINTDLTDLR